MTVVVSPATAARFPDAAAILAPKKPGAQGCWCLPVRLGPAEDAALRAPARAARIEQLCAGPHAPGVVAYEGAKPVGWAGIAPRDELHEYGRTRYRPSDAADWVVYCFRVRAGHTGRGIAHALLAGAVDHARASGATRVVGHPIDGHGDRLDRTLASVGTRGMFERAGFVVVRELTGRRSGHPQVATHLDL